MATLGHAGKHQLIPWAESASSRADSALGPGDMASSSSSLLPRAKLHSISLVSFFGGGELGSLLNRAKCAGRWVGPKVPLKESAPEDDGFL